MTQEVTLVLLVFALAWLTEAFVEYVFGYLFGLFEVLKPYKVALPYIALAVGIGLCFYYASDLIVLITNQTATPVGIVLTGFLVSRGAGFVNDFLSFLTGKMKQSLWA